MPYTWGLLEREWLFSGDHIVRMKRMLTRRKSWDKVGKQDMQ
jgi:hypothetical protein